MHHKLIISTDVDASKPGNFTYLYGGLGYMREVSCICPLTQKDNDEKPETCHMKRNGRPVCICYKGDKISLCKSLGEITANDLASQYDKVTALLGDARYQLIYKSISK